MTLLAFNSHGEARSFQSLMDELQVAEDVLKKTLHSFACGKFKVLKRVEARSVGGGGGEGEREKGGGISKTDSFVVNESFRYTILAAESKRSNMKC